jgi:hypothetical protein
LFYDALVEVIMSVVRPDSWPDGTGPGPIRYLENAQAIVVPQVQQVHAEIAELLAALRAVREKQRAGAQTARRLPVAQPPKTTTRFACMFTPDSFLPT